MAGGVKKGDVLAVARLAGIMGAKRTPDLIPLCHPLALTSVSVELRCDAARNAVDDHGDLQAQGPHRRRDGSADRRRGRRAHRLRHVQGGRSRHAHRRHPPASTNPAASPALTRRSRDDLGRRSARAACWRRSTPLGAEQVSLADALGRVLAEDVAARRTQPPFAVSAMDGYAVRAADVPRVPARLTLVGAGRRRAGSYDGTRQARRGRAHLHRRAGARRAPTAIVIQEDTERDGDIVTVREAPRAGPLCAPGRARFPRRRYRPCAPGRRSPRAMSALAAAMNRPWLLGAAAAARRHPARPATRW